MGWLIPSEVQPLETRSVGQSFATAVNFLVGHLLQLSTEGCFHNQGVRHDDNVSGKCGPLRDC